MSDATDQPAPAGGELPPPRRRILRDTTVLPTLMTLMNGIAGFASIHYATKGGLGLATGARLSGAAWLVFVAMAFDAIDGRLARMTRQATDFGAQLDSLCDAISFGVAPAVLMVQTVSMALRSQLQPFDVFEATGSHLGRLVMAIAALYMCCALLRLARFNTENAPDVLHHMDFKGLPSPAAAAAVAALVLLFDYVQTAPTGWKAAPWLMMTAGATLPAMTSLVALLMVSRFGYPHLINQLIIGRRSLWFIVAAVAGIVVSLLFLQLALTLAVLIYVASGPAAAAVRKARAAGEAAD